MPARIDTFRKDQVPLTIADDSVPARETDDPVFGNLINEGEDFEQPLSDAELIQAKKAATASQVLKTISG